MCFDFCLSKASCLAIFEWAINTFEDGAEIRLYESGFMEPKLYFFLSFEIVAKKVSLTISEKMPPWFSDKITFVSRVCFLVVPIACYIPNIFYAD